MKKNQIFLFFTFILISVYGIGCKGDAGSTGPTGPSGPQLSGKVTGLVTLIDTNGAQPTNRSGVTVTIEGTSRSTTTDSTGHWQFDTLLTGVYTFDFSKATYGTTKIQTFQFAGGGTAYAGNPVMSEVPNFQVSNLTFTSGNGFIDVTGMLTLGTPQTTGRNILLFVGSSNNVSSNPSQYIGVISAFANGVSTTFTERITTATMTGFGFGTGSAAYLIAYSSSAVAASCSRYLDQTTGKFTYTSLGNPSGVLQVVAPDKPVINSGSGN